MRINNRDLIKKIENAAFTQASSYDIPSVVTPIIDVSPEKEVNDVVNATITTGTTSATLFTGQTGEDIFIRGLTLALAADPGAALAECTAKATIKSNPASAVILGKIAHVLAVATDQVVYIDLSNNPIQLQDLGTISLNVDNGAATYAAHLSVYLYRRTKF